MTGTFRALPMGAGLFSTGRGLPGCPARTPWATALCGLALPLLLLDAALIAGVDSFADRHGPVSCSRLIS